MSNDYVDDFCPQSKPVDGRTFVLLSKRSKKFFRFCVGECMPRQRGSQQILSFWTVLSKARSNASQLAFQKTQMESDDQENNPPNTKKRKRNIRRARMDDALTAGQVVDVPMTHHGKDITIKALFGVKNSDLWVEASADTMDFIQKAFAHDHAKGEFAATKGRGPHFCKGDSEDSEDDDGDDDDDDDEDEAVQ
jgi:hypothetical protein